METYVSFHSFYRHWWFFLHCDIKYFACDIYTFQFCTSMFSRHTGEPLTHYIPLLDTYIGNTQREAPSGVQRFLFTPGLHSEQVDLPVVTPCGQDSGVRRKAQSPGINWNKSESFNFYEMCLYSMKCAYIPYYYVKVEKILEFREKLRVQASTETNQKESTLQMLDRNQKTSL